MEVILAFERRVDYYSAFSYSLVLSKQMIGKVKRWKNIVLKYEYWHELDIKLTFSGDCFSF